jgi:hypothetical protein
MSNMSVNLSVSPETESALLALPVGTVITVNEGTGSTTGSTFTLVTQFTGGAGVVSATTTTSASFMPGMAYAQYFTATY